MIIVVCSNLKKNTNFVRQPYLSMQNYFYLIPAAVSLFWILRIFFLKDVNKVQLLICAGMLMALFTLFYRHASAAFMFPFFYLAIRQKTSPSGILKWDWLIFLPSMAIIPFTDTLSFDIFLLVQISAITVWSVISVRRYGKKLAEIYDANEISAEDISQAMIFIILSVIATGIIVLLPDDVTSSLPLQFVLVAFLAILQYYVGYYTFKIKDIPELSDDGSCASAENGTAANAGAEAAAPAGTSQDDKLLQRVIDEKMYLDSTLSLVTLAEKLHTNRTYLSSSIHNCKGQNFSDFINTLRIKHFIDIIQSDDEAGIKDAAFNSGYNNLQSFYRNFSEIMQMTPKTWVSHNKK